MSIGLPHDRVDAPLAGHAREVDAELVEQVRLLLLLGPVGRIEVEHVHLYLGAEIVAHGELLQVGGDDLGRDAVHLQRPGRSGGGIGGDHAQGMGRGDAAHGARLLAQFVGEAAVERFGVARLFLRLVVGYLVFDAQTDLIDLPVLQPGREKLERQGTLLAQQFECEVVLQRPGDARFGGVERGASKDAFERLRNFHLHVASFF